MIRFAKSVVRRAPGLERLLRRLYYAARAGLEHVVGTRINEFAWRFRRAYDSQNAEAGFRESVAHPHRTRLVAAIADGRTVTSALEIGSFSGANLLLLAKQFPDATFDGIDVNRGAVTEGNARFRELGLTRVQLHVGRGSAIDFPDKSFDVVFSDAALMYVGPDQIHAVLREMLRIARRAVVISEWHSDATDLAPRSKRLTDHWIHDFRSYTAEFSPAKVTLERYADTDWTDATWRKFGVIVTIQVA